MNSLSQLSHLLADEEISATEVLASFTQLGFITGTQDIKRGLELAAMLNTRFRSLVVVLPTAKTALQRFINCAQIFQNLNAKTTVFVTTLQVDSTEHVQPNNTHIKTDYCKYILNEFKRSEIATHSDKLDELTLVWLVALLQDWNPRYSALKASLPVTRDLDAVYECIHLMMDKLSSSSTMPDSMRLPFRVKKILQSEWDFGAPSAVKRVKGPLQYAAQPTSIEHVKKYTVTALPITTEIKIGFQLGVPPSVRSWNKLTERERLSAHYLAMPTDDLKKLCQAIRNTLKTPDGYTIEAFVSALALSTGKTISELLNVSVDHSNDESISLQLNITSDRNLPVWSRNLSPEENTLSIVLPEFLKSPIDIYLPKKSIGLISDYLPPSEISWEERTYAWLTENSGVRKVDLSREIKYALMRELYSSGSNSAVTEWLTRPTSKDAESIRTRDALSFYLSYERNQNPMVLDQYRNAIKTIFGTYGRVDQAAPFRIGGKARKTISLKAYVAVSPVFRQRIEQAKQNDDFVQYHNWLSAYCLLLLIVSTGHRVSRSPFHFKWDLLLDDRLAFICDKAVVGSEARFVPLADTVVDQLKQYFKHVDAIGIWLKLKFKQTESTFPPCPFFILDANKKAKPFSTDLLQKQFLDGLGDDVKLKIKSFRSELANVLWEKGLDGFDLDALLGHNRNLHVFGDASTWSAQEWADRVRPKINDYLNEANWTVVPAWKSVSDSKHSYSNLHCPEFAASSMGYEGRQRDGAQAIARAREAVQSILSSEYLRERNWRLTEADIKQIKDSLAITLSHDPAARDKTLAALRKDINRLAPALESINSPTINLQRTEAGPVDILSARHFSVAAAIRTGWKSAYSKDAAFKDPEKQRIAHLAHISVSLVMFDGVLDVKQLKYFILAIAKQSFYKIDDRLVVRTEVELSSNQFEKALILSPSSAALVLGFNRINQGISTDTDLNDVERAASDILIRILSRRVKAHWKFTDLVTVFKPWWFIRLPGCLYSIASGKYLGPALDIQSEAAIFNGDAKINGVATNIHIATSREPSIASDQDQALAKKEFSSLLKQARLRFEDEKGNSKQQRIRLKQYLSAPQSPELARLIDERQIVALLFAFLDYLLSEGGKRTKDLRFGSIATYLTSILPELIHQGWDEDFLKFDEDEYLDFYRKLKSATKNKDSSTFNTVIALFHRFLQWQINAQFVPGLGLADSNPKRIRSAVITSDAFEQAFRQVRNTKDVDVFEAEFASQLMTLTYGFGHRFKEAYGLTVNSITSDSGPSTYVGNNRFRAVKSKRPRIVDVHNLQNHQRDFLLKQIRIASSQNTNDPALFSDPTRTNTLYPTHRIAQIMTAALRSVTNGSKIVPHTMRHTYATCVAMAVLPRLNEKGHSEIIYSKLASHIYREQLALPIKAGFAGWPFWMERAAMLMGHEDVSTLFNTYWHTSHYAIADYTFREDQINDLSRQQLAQMTGVRGSAITQQANRLKAASADKGREIPNIELVQHCIHSSAAPSLADKIAEYSPITPKIKGRPKKVAEADSRANNFTWQSIDRLLCERQHDEYSFGTLVAVATNEFGVNKGEATNIVDCYTAICEMTGFDDFEPYESELSHSKTKLGNPIQRSSIERQRFISTVQQMCHEKPNFRTAIISLCAAWIERVDAKTPWIVAKSAVEANVFIQLLLDLGAQEDQFHVKVVSYKPDDINLLDNLASIKDISYGSKRVSRGASNIKVSEIGINIGQLKSASLPDGRDLHRAIFVLALMLKCDAM